MSDVKLNLLVLKTHQLDRLKDFYSALGISFAEEKHGDGPLHLAARVGNVVLELYPLQKGEADSTTRLGFSVPDLDGVLARLEAAVVGGPRETEWGRRAVVKDPDGRRVEVVEGDGDGRPAGHRAEHAPDPGGRPHRLAGRRR